MVMLVITTGMYFRHNFRDNFIKNFIAQEVESITDQYSASVYCPFIRQSSHDKKGFPPELAYQTKIALGTTSADIVRVHNQYRQVVFESILNHKLPFVDAVVEKVITPRYITALVGDDNATTHWVKYTKRVSIQQCQVDDLEQDSLFIDYYYDVTELVEQVAVLQLWMSFGLVFVFGVLYVLMYLTSKKVEQLLQQHLTKRKGLEMAISQVSAENEAKSMFLANITHELRTPLNAIIGFSEMMRDEIMGPLGHEQYKEYINDINVSGTHLLGLINDILDYSKAEADRLEVENISVDITKVIQSSMRMLEPRSKKHGVILRGKLPEESVIIQSDPRRIKQVILNLLSNAIKFTPEGKHVTLTLKEMSTKIKIIVADEGIGLAPEDIPKALMPFGQIDNSLSKRYEGTGLGLPLTKKLTEIMGGEFIISSSLGNGTEVTLIFNKQNNNS